MKRGGPLKRHTPMKRGGPLRKQSKKTASRERKAADVRRSWVNAAGRTCMACGYSAQNPNPEYPPILSKVVCHEIANGPMRLKCLDKPFGVLCICRFCNEYEFVKKSLWPEARQLCLLMVRAPERYDLRAYIAFTSPAAPNRITRSEVAEYLETITCQPFSHMQQIARHGTRQPFEPRQSTRYLKM